MLDGDDFPAPLLPPRNDLLTLLVLIFFKF